MTRRLRIGLVVLLGLTASSAAAPSVRLSFSDGRVWLVADRASVGDILAEWSRVGSTRIVNGERVAGPLLTLEMSGVPESQALDVVLRTAGGFVAVERTAGTDSTAPNMSRFGQITVVPAATAVAAQAPIASEPPAVPPAAAPEIFTAFGTMRIIGADGQPVPDDQEGAPPRPAEAAVAASPPVPPASAGVAAPGMIPGSTAK
jgi:hypothetical protein